MFTNEEKSKSTWFFKSSTKQFNAYLLGMGLLGLFMISITKSRIAESDNFMWAYWGGVFLIALAVGVFIFFESAVIEVDNQNRRLLIQRNSHFGKRSYILPFDNVESVLVTSLGKGYRGVVTHHLVITLKNGKREIPGLASLMQSEVIEIAERLAADIGCKCIVARKYYPINLTRLALATVGSVLFFLIYYRLAVGPWGLDMWSGTTPPLIMALSFLSLLRILRRF